MRYDEFRDRLREAFREVGLIGHSDQTVETVDIERTTRRWKVYLRLSSAQNTDPFYLSAKVAFDWSPVNAARSYTCEEDLLAALLGRKQRPTKTEERWARVDIDLAAGFAGDTPAPMPDLQIFSAWTASVQGKLSKLLTEFKERQGRVVTITGGLGQIKLETRCEAQGVLILESVSTEGFQLVRIPRIWDDPKRRKAEKEIGRELAQLARRFKDVCDEWARSVAEVATWIRYLPPPTESKPSRLLKQGESGGPESVH